MKKTIGELIEIDSVVGSLYKKNENLENSKFGYAYSRFVKKNLQSYVDSQIEKVYDIRLENAMEDKETGEVIPDNSSVRGFKFSKESLKKVVSQERKIEKEFLAKEVELELFLTSYIPEVISEYEKEILSGVVLKLPPVGLPVEKKK